MKIACALAVWPFFAHAQSGYADAHACAVCHPAIAASYAQTGMARSFYRPGPENKTGRYFHAPSNTWFTMLERDGKYFQRRSQIGFGGLETNIDEKQIDFVMGSGNHVRTFLHRTSAGALQELPLAWYAEKGGYFAMNPGYDTPDQPNSRRKITYECMFCHNGYPKIPAGNEQFRAEPIFSNPLPEGIDCQRCHGPGQRHADVARTAAATRAEIRHAIVNPARLAPDRRMEVCMQCHLETTSFPFPHSILKYERHPFSYRPGEPLVQFMLFFDHQSPSDDRFQIVNSAYRLRMSPCFLKSGGALQCTTCHDPHKTSEPQSIDRACAKCHASLNSGHPASTTCVDCHMPKRRTQDVVHAIMTDHYIQRRPPSIDPAAEIPEPHGAATVYRGEVLPYYPAPFERTPESEAYLGLAQVREKNNMDRGVERFAAALRGYPQARAEFYIELGDAWIAQGHPANAIPLYREAARRNPESLAAWLALGSAYEKSDDLVKAVESFERATKIVPRDASSWQQLGQAYTKLRRTTDAMAALRESIKLDPEIPETHYALGIVLAQQAANPSDAEASFREAIRLRPDDAPANMNLAILLFGRDRPDEARYHFEYALRFQPGYVLGHFNYGLMLEGTGRIDEARRQMEAAVAADPNYFPAQLRLGAILMNQGRKDQAVPHLRKASESPDPAIRRNALELLTK
ncbi:MAG TPA: tetratricopeptide repeat protein [Bryobacteraceae bacterium]|nr:tetratricopeptide repeat protein [Bryobacteraceae bacterium]